MWIETEEDHATTSIRQGERAAVDDDLEVRVIKLDGDVRKSLTYGRSDVRDFYHGQARSIAEIEFSNRFERKEIGEELIGRRRMCGNRTCKEHCWGHFSHWSPLMEPAV